jgi:hypothetical protein
MIKKLDVTVEQRTSTYKRGAKLFFLLFILYVIWIISVILGVYLLNMGYSWAVLSLDLWIYSAIALIGVFIALELILLIRYQTLKKRQIIAERPQPVLYKGKKLHAYTTPKDAEGGFFSRTYIQIDKDNILRLRTLIIPPEELWGQKTEQ